MKIRYFIALLGLVVSDSAYANCLSDQREWQNLESSIQTLAVQQRLCDMARVGLRMSAAKAAFYRRCYSELGISELAGESQAHDAEEAASAFSLLRQQYCQ